MKVVTIHLACDGQPVDFEFHDDGQVVVVGYDDLEIDEAALELGFQPTECLDAYTMATSWPLLLLTGIVSDVAAGGVGMKNAAVFYWRDVMTQEDHDKLDEIYERGGYSELNFSGVWFADLQDDMLFDVRRDPAKRVKSWGDEDNISEKFLDKLQWAFEQGFDWLLVKER